MSGNRSVPTKQNDLLTWSATFAGVLDTSGSLYFQSAAQIAAYKVAQVAFAEALADSSAKQTRTQLSVITTRETMAALLKLSRSYAKMIQANLDISDRLKVQIGLQLPKPPAPRPAPGTAPVLLVDRVVNNTVSVRLIGVDPTKRGLPADAAGCTLFAHTGETPPTLRSGWEYVAASSRTTFDVPFDPALPAGTTVLLSAFWQSGRDVSGPACAPVKVTLTGGGVLPSSSAANDAMKLAA